MTTVADLENVTPLGGDTLARKWVIDVNVAYGVSETAEWVRLRGVQDQSPNEEPQTQDSSNYDSGGWTSTAVTAMSWGWEITVTRKADNTGVAYDTAQEYLRGKSLQMGPANVAEVRAYEWNGVDGPRVQAYQGLVGVSYAEQGGAHDALSTAQFTLSGQGRRLDIEHPAGPQTWAANTEYFRGDQVIGSDESVLQATNSGESGSTAPSAATLTDGDITWKVVVAP